MEYLWRVYRSSDNSTICSGRVADYHLAYANICSHRGLTDSVTWTSRNDIACLYVGYIPSISGQQMWSRHCCIMKVEAK